MDEGQVVRWKDGLSGTLQLLHDHTSDHITHKTLGYYLLWDQMDPNRSGPILMRCTMITKSDRLNEFDSKYLHLSTYHLSYLCNLFNRARLMWDF